MTSMNLKMLQKKMTPAHKRGNSVKNVGRRRWRHRKLTRSKADSDELVSR